MMKKILIMFTIFVSVVAVGILKASTKSRVYGLESSVVNLSKSTRRAWDTIAELNAKLSKIERNASAQVRKMADRDEEEDAVEDYGDDDENDDEDDYHPYPKPKSKRNRN